MLEFCFSAQKKGFLYSKRLGKIKCDEPIVTVGENDSPLMTVPVTTSLYLLTHAGRALEKMDNHSNSSRHMTSSGLDQVSNLGWERAIMIL